MGRGVTRGVTTTARLFVIFFKREGNYHNLIRSLYYDPLNILRIAAGRHLRRRTRLAEYGAIRLINFTSYL